MNRLLLKKICYKPDTVFDKIRARVTTGWWQRTIQNKALYNQEVDRFGNTYYVACWQLQRFLDRYHRESR